MLVGSIAEDSITAEGGLSRAELCSVSVHFSVASPGGKRTWNGGEVQAVLMSLGVSENPQAVNRLEPSFGAASELPPVPLHFRWKCNDGQRAFPPESKRSLISFL